MPRYVNNKKIPEEENLIVGYAKHKQVFTDKHVELMEEYLKSAASICFRLASVDVEGLHTIMLHSLILQHQNHGIEDEVLAQIGLRAL